MKEFGENLRHWRKRRNLSRKDIADKLHVTSAAVGFYEQGRVFPDVRQARIIAQALNVSLDELLGIALDGMEKCKDFWQEYGYRIEENADGTYILIYSEKHNKKSKMMSRKLHFDNESKLEHFTDYAKQKINKGVLGFKKIQCDSIVDDVYNLMSYDNFSGLPSAVV